jgi:hypothetical protein
MGKIDYRVPYLATETIADVAGRCWNSVDQSRAFTFDVVKFIEGTLIEKGIDSFALGLSWPKGKLSLQLFDREFEQDDPAFVTFKQMGRRTDAVLNVDRKIWQRALEGESYARWILAHEVGHILLHDYYENAFTINTPSQELPIGQREHYAEWQADEFAYHLMLPTHVVRKFDDIAIIAAACNMPETIAWKRVEAVRNTKKPLRNYDGEVCGGCGNLTLVRSGRSLLCDTCGRRFETL